MLNRLEEGASTLEVGVRFAETDAMGVVHHAAYVVWLEAGRVAWLDAAGAPYAGIAAGGHHFAVTGLQVSYRRSVRFGATVLVVTRLAQLRSRKVDFAYELFERDAAGGRGALLATAVSQHVCVDLDGHVATVPAAVLAVMHGAQESGLAHDARVQGQAAG